MNSKDRMGMILEELHSKVNEDLFDDVDSSGISNGNDMVDALERGIRPFIGDNMLSVQFENSFGHYSLCLKYVSITPEENRKSNVAVYNAGVQITIFVWDFDVAGGINNNLYTDAKINGKNTWDGQIKAMRKVKGDGKKIVDGIIKYFRTNRDALNVEK
jgi:hypothetical protein